MCRELKDVAEALGFSAGSPECIKFIQDELQKFDKLELEKEQKRIESEDRERLARIELEKEQKRIDSEEKERVARIELEKQKTRDGRQTEASGV